MDQSLNAQVNPAPAQNTPAEQPSSHLSTTQPSNKGKKVVLVIGCALALVVLLALGVWYLLSARNKTQQAALTNYFSPEPTASASPSSTDLTTGEASIDASLNQLNQDQTSIDQGLKDQGDSFSNL